MPPDHSTPEMLAEARLIDRAASARRIAFVKEMLPGLMAAEVGSATAGRRRALPIGCPGALHEGLFIPGDLRSAAKRALQAARALWDEWQAGGWDEAGL